MALIDQGDGEKAPAQDRRRRHELARHGQDRPEDQNDRP
jgi:hypothetical protein